jgi:hypothetical protein
MGEIEPQYTQIPSASGKGQWTGRCPECRICVVSIYGFQGSSPKESPITIIRVGTMDKPEVLELTAQIYVSTKLPWVKLAEGIQSFDEGYDPRLVWNREQLQRFEECVGRPLTWW